MSDFLASMAAASRLRAEGARRGPGVADLTSRAMSARPVIPLVVSDGGFDLMAEPKLASPSGGRLIADGDDRDTVAGLAAELAASGVAALSVLTEPTSFAGDIGHLGMVSDVLEVPVMRKDFLVDPIQILEARAAGASGVLLIARIVDSSLLVDMTDLALDLGMFALVELFDASDLEVASSVFDRDVLIGVNARDLGTLEVDPGRHGEMMGLLPRGLPLVAESGIVGVPDVERIAEMGYRMALVGTALVSCEDPGSLAREMIRAGRETAGIRGAL